MKFCSLKICGVHFAELAIQTNCTNGILAKENKNENNIAHFCWAFKRFIDSFQFLF